MPVKRWPKRVYGVGTEPDPRFSLANERTFLAWLRTALALMASGVAVEAVGPGEAAVRHTIAIGLILIGVITGTTSFARWMRTERAMRLGEPLPSPRLAPVIGYGIAIAGILACVLVLTR